jgi:hypothetical protein
MRTPFAFTLAVFSLMGQPPPDPGIKAGQPLPAFRLEDQSGKQQTFQSLRGKKGLMLVFFRSADW